MQDHKMTTLLTALALVMVAPAWAEEEAAAEEAAAEAPAEAAPASEAKPREAEIMPLAAKSLLLGVVRTDNGFVAVGERGHILLSKDGKEWQQQKVPVRATLTAVSFPTATTGYAVGHDAVILKTTDGGKTWVLQNWAPELEKPLLDVMFSDENRGIAVGAYGLYFNTTDGGATWNRVNNSVTEEEWHFNSIVRLADGSLLIVGEAGGVARSADEGLTWTRLASPYEGSFFGALPLGDKGALILGLRGNLFRVEDVSAAKAMSGEADAAPPPAAASAAIPGLITASGEFQEVSLDTIQTFLGGTQLPDGRLLVVGVNGVVAVGDGRAMRLVENPVGMSLSAVVPASEGVLAVGERGSQILKP